MWYFGKIVIPTHETRLIQHAKSRCRLHNRSKKNDEIFLRFFDLFFFTAPCKLYYLWVKK